MFKFLAAGATEYQGNIFVYNLPGQDEEWATTKHPSAQEWVDGRDCGPNRLHVMRHLDSRYAPLNWWPWWAEPCGTILGESPEKISCTAIKLKRIVPRVFWRMLKLGWARDRVLTRAPLYLADLRGANLSGADLSYSNLGRAFLTDADLSRAQLQYANLQGAILTGANLTGANLSHANLENARLADANLTNALLFRANLGNANLWGAIVDKAILEGSYNYPHSYPPWANYLGEQVKATICSD